MWAYTATPAGPSANGDGSQKGPDVLKLFCGTPKSSERKKDTFHQSCPAAYI